MELKMRLVFVVVIVLAKVVAAATQALPGCTETCGDGSIPYPPYGIGVPSISSKSCFLKQSLELVCKDSTLYLRGVDLKIWKISLKGQLGMPALISSPDNKRVRKQGKEARLPVGTAFVISKEENSFLSVGCDTYGFINNIHGSIKKTTGSLARCNNMADIQNDGSCTGIGCCKVDIPLAMKNNNISIEANSFSNFNTSWGFNNCSYSFMAKKGGYNMVVDCSVGEDGREVSRQKIYDRYIRTGNISGYGYRCRSADVTKASREIHTIWKAAQMRSYWRSLFEPLLSIILGRDGSREVAVLEASVRSVSLGQEGFGALHPTAVRRTYTGYAILPEDEITPEASLLSHVGLESGDGKREGKGCHRIVVLTKGAIIGLGVGLLILIVGASCIYLRYRKRKLINLKDKFFEKNGGLILQQKLLLYAKIFTAEQLMKATNNFDERLIIGKGHNSTVFKGILSNNRVVAIKKFRELDLIEKFIDRLVLLEQTRHRNVVPFLGCCLESEVPLVVYEFFSNGTLFDKLHKEDKISWRTRLQIAIDAARALDYLHSDARMPIIHSNVSSANILLDDTFTAKLLFGFANLSLSSMHQVGSDLYYLDPEYIHRGQLTEKSDVYSFGVVLAELIIGDKPFEKPEGGFPLNLGKE